MFALCIGGYLHCVLVGVCTVFGSHCIGGYEEEQQAGCQLDGALKRGGGDANSAIC